MAWVGERESDGAVAERAPKLRLVPDLTESELRGPEGAGSAARPERVRVGVRIRNANYLKLAISWCFIAAMALAVNLQSSFNLRELGWFILGAPLALGVFEAVKWRRAFLRVEASGVTVRRIVRQRTFAWDEIDRFVISEPGDRTPLMLSFAWWADRCALLLRTGARYPVPAVQPYHGFTILTFLNLRRWTSADAVVDDLNAMVGRARSLP